MRVGFAPLRAVHDDGGAQGPEAVADELRGRLRDDHGGRGAEALPGVGGGQSGVAPRRRHQRVGALRDGLLARVPDPPELERTRGLQGVELEVDVAAEDLGHGLGYDQRGADVQRAAPRSHHVAVHRAELIAALHLGHRVSLGARHPWDREGSRPRGGSGGSRGGGEGALHRGRRGRSRGRDAHLFSAQLATDGGKCNHRFERRGR